VFPNQNVNVRSQPSPVARQISVGMQGQRMDVLAQDLGNDNQRWYRVRFEVEDSTIVGWVRADLVIEAGEGCPPFRP